jgi:hypothetical protein
MAKQKKKTEGFLKLVNRKSSRGLGDLKSAHEACMQCIQLALSEKMDASVYYAVLDVKTNKVISEELIFSYNIERIRQVEDEM